LRPRAIRVTIEPDVESHLDQAIALVNETHELNFTKDRLKTDMEKARRKLRKRLAGINKQAGLVRVADGDRDYGYCGFFVAHTKGDRTRLSQFCFAPEIRGLGVEHWLYDKLKRPDIEVVGNVASDLSRPVPIDWICEERLDDVPALRRAAVSGRCSVAGLVHYFRSDGYDVTAAVDEIRDSIIIRRDHTQMIRYALEGLTESDLAVLRLLGFEDSDFQTKLIDEAVPPALVVLGHWGDTQKIMWRHKASGLLVPHALKRPGKRARKRKKKEMSERAKAANAYLHDHFEFAGAMPEDQTGRNLDLILDKLPAGIPLFVILAPDRRPDGSLVESAVALNRCTSEASQRHPRKTLIALSLTDFLGNEARHSVNHFHRNVYHRMYREILARHAMLLGDTQPANGR